MMYVEVRSHRNNLIFRGLKINENTDLVKLVTDFSKDVLKVDLNSDFLFFHCKEEIYLFDL